MEFVIRKYKPTDLPGVRNIYGDDEFARPRLLGNHPRFREYLADEVTYYFTHYEQESIFIAEAKGEIVGALLGAKDTKRQETFYKRFTNPYLIKRCLSGTYGWPVWLHSVFRTHIADKKLVTPQVDYSKYPAHLHIGVLPEWRRKGIGTRMMEQYGDYLAQNSVPGYHLYASSFHAMGVAFYRKLGLEELGKFDWRFHDGYQWLDVTEIIFGLRLS